MYYEGNGKVFFYSYVDISRALSYYIYFVTYVEFPGPLVSTPPMIGKVSLLFRSYLRRCLMNQSCSPSPDPPPTDGRKTFADGFLRSGWMFCDFFGRR